MKSKLFTARSIFITTTILLVAISRLFPHIPNFTPVAAMALFGGVYFTDKRVAFIVPLLAMLLSDIALQLLFGWGFHSTMIYVYISFILTSVIGLIIRRNITVSTITAGSLISSVLFFIITNFGVWASSGMDSGIIGLNATYLLGIPFFAPTAIGDLFFNCVLFGSFYAVCNSYPSFKLDNVTK